MMHQTYYHTQVEGNSSTDLIESFLTYFFTSWSALVMQLLENGTRLHLMEVNALLLINRS